MNLVSMKRHQSILNKLEEQKYVEVAELCKELNVSAVTIRKDLKFLEEKGLLHRTHGGASFENPYINDRSVNEKEKIRVDEKSNIALEAASRITENDSILIASGTTVQALARAIDVTEKLTVITASLNVALELIRFKHVDVLQLCGYVRHSSSSVVGNQAASILENVSCSKLYLGVDGIDLEYGLSTTHLEEAQLNRKMIEAAERTIVLADSSKFGKKSFGRICSLDDIDEIITDSGINKALIPRLEERGVVVTIVAK
ncbi:DeoR/GlpR family DNA-binding transcription regulator [Neptunitalea lumnitzerae]|uniref:DeoR family transcriptional regulator n=1 Tax=Neptunitalea lumnitzerae TaxID=2965509 RepID=A0ABQ5MLB8_9FLAO|nr:DeoR/GlpR family DNA-binding transcription regulator [Neptunitalea sp. Y10]GLB50189.1 DeoR family transcriptional regulator [Neptunitalea sp. Y10]